MTSTSESFVSTPTSDGFVVAVQTDINLKSSPELRTFLMDLLTKKPQRLVVDLSAVSFMDSSGVATLVEVLRTQKQNGNKLVLCAMQERVRSVFQISRLDTLFAIVDDVDAAAKA